MSLTFLPACTLKVCKLTKDNLSLCLFIIGRFDMHISFRFNVTFTNKMRFRCTIGGMMTKTRIDITSSVRIYHILVIFILIASFYVFVSHRRLNSIFQHVDAGVQSTIDYLTYLRLNIQQNLNPSPIQLNFHTDHYETEDINNSYNDSNYEQQCPQHRYTIRIIEKNPLVIYIENFLTAFEIQHIIELTLVRQTIKSFGCVILRTHMF